MFFFMPRMEEMGRVTKVRKDETAAELASGMPRECLSGETPNPQWLFRVLVLSCFRDLYFV